MTDAALIKNLDNVMKIIRSNMIGFDQFDEMVGKFGTPVGYPPYNIKKIDDNQYVIEMAVAGFGKNDITVKFEDGKIIVSGKASADSDENSYLYRGIAKREFNREFSLNSNVEITSADMTNGMLRLWLERLIPESMRAKIIPISTAEEEESTQRGTTKVLSKK